MKNKNPAKYNFILLIFISFFRFCGDSYFYGFLGRYLKTLPIDDTRLGLLLSIIPFMAIIGNLVISKIGTTVKRNKIIVGIWTVIECTFIIASGFCTEFWFVVMFDIICNFFSNSFYNLFDTFILPITQRANKTYSAGRMWGTLAYIVGALTGGVIIERISYKYTFIIGGSMMLIGGLLFFFLKFSDFENDQEDEAELKQTPKLKELFKDKNFVFYMVAMALLIGCNWATDNGFVLYTDALNVSPSVYGYSYGWAIIAEALTLLGFSRVRKKTSLKNLIFIACGASVLRNCLLATPNLNVNVYLISEGLRGLNYGLVLTCNLNLIEYILGKRLMKKGFFITIILDEIISSVVDFFMPTVITKIGFTPVFLSISGLLVISTILFSLVKIKPLSFDEQQSINLKSQIGEVQNG